MPSISADWIVILATASRKATLLLFDHFNVSGNKSSKPVAPASASAKGSSLASLSTGAWSEQMASIVPSLTPKHNASLSRSVLSGGFKWALESK